MESLKCQNTHTHTHYNFHRQHVAAIQLMLAMFFHVSLVDFMLVDKYAQVTSVLIAYGMGTKDLQKTFNTHHCKSLLAPGGQVVSCEIFALPFHIRQRNRMQYNICSFSRIKVKVAGLGGYIHKQ